MGNKVGLIGVGLVGTAMAERLITAGYEVVGYDIDPERREALERLGGRAAGSPVAVASAASRVLLSLPSSEIVREVVTGRGGVLEAGPLPRFVIDTTTGAPEDAEEMGRLLAGHRVDFLDATISGSSATVRQGEAVFIIGGDEEAVAACGDLFDALTGRAVRVGPVGSGARMKLVVNLVLGLNRLALAEGLVFAEAAGLEPAAVLELLRGTVAYSRVMDTKGHRMVGGDFQPEARLAQHRKDVGLILDEARRAAQELPLSAAHLEVLEAAIAAGDGDLDNSAVIREVRRRRRPA